MTIHACTNNSYINIKHVLNLSYQLPDNFVLMQKAHSNWFLIILVHVIIQKNVQVAILNVRKLYCKKMYLVGNVNKLRL